MMANNNNNNNDNNKKPKDSATNSSLVIVAPGSESTVLQTAQTETSLRLRRVADSFVVNARAKESIASSQLGQFYELLCVRLRLRLADLDARSRQVGQDPSLNKDVITSAISSVVSPASLVGQNTGPAALALVFLSQSGLLMPNAISMRSLLVVGLLVTLKQKMEQLTVDLERERCRNVVLQFVHSAKTSFSASASSPVAAETGLEIERSVRELASAISLRHIDQVVPLNKSSQQALADVMVNRIIRHLSRSRFGFENESRSPIVAALQRQRKQAMDVYNRYVLPQDRIHEPKTLTLLQRSIRALTAEKSAQDDVILEFEPWFTVPNDSNSNSKQPWTASGVLAKTGIRIRTSIGSTQQQGVVHEVFYGHELTDAETYGFAYGDEQECRERRMSPLQHYNNNDGDKSTTTSSFGVSSTGNNSNNENEMGVGSSPSSNVANHKKKSKL